MKFLKNLVLAVTVLGLLATLPVISHAQEASDSTTDANTEEQGVGVGEILTGAALVAFCVTNPANPACTEAAKATVGSAAAEATGTALEGTASAIISVVALFILTLANLLLGIAGTLFNWVVVKTIFQFSSLIGNSPGLLIAWGILRDVGNMLLLFGFIFIGLATILNLSTYTAKKTLPFLIIFAVLMNFSLFAAEAVIDVSNGLGSMLYTQANTDACLELGGAVDVETEGGLSQENCAVNYGIAGHIMQSTGLDTLFGARDEALSFGQYFEFKTAAALVGLALFATIGAVVLFAASIMLIVRAVTLTLLMVTAPLGFAGMAIPPLQKAAKEWWHQLLNQSFFAPILLLLIFISLKITDSFAGGANSSLAGALTSPNSSVMGVIMVFFLVIGFLVASLVAAKRLGAVGAGFAVKTAGGVTGRFTAGSLAWTGRRTVGAASGALAGKVRSSDFGKTNWGRRTATLLDKPTKSTFDIRNTGPVKQASKGSGIEFGKPGKSLEDERKAAVEKRTKHAATLEMSREQKEDDKKLRANKKEKEDDWKERSKELKKEAKDLESSIANNEDGAREAELRNQITDAQRRGGEAITRGDTDVFAAAGAEAKNLQDQLNGIAEQKKRDSEKLNQARAKYESEAKSYNKEIERIDKAIELNNPQGQFAKNIDGTGMGKIFLGKQANRKAAEKIRGDLKKSPTQRTLEQLKGSIDSGKSEIKDEVKGKVEEVKEAIEEEDSEKK